MNSHNIFRAARNFLHHKTVSMEEVGKNSRLIIELIHLYLGCFSLLLEIIPQAIFSRSSVLLLPEYFSTSIFLSNVRIFRNLLTKFSIDTNRYTLQN